MGHPRSIVFRWTNGQTDRLWIDRQVDRWTDGGMDATKCIISQGNKGFISVTRIQWKLLFYTQIRMWLITVLEFRCMDPVLGTALCLRYGTRMAYTTLSEEIVHSTYHHLPLGHGIGKVKWSVLDVFATSFTQNDVARSRLFHHFSGVFVLTILKISANLVMRFRF